VNHDVEIDLAAVRSVVASLEDDVCASISESERRVAGHAVPVGNGFTNSGKYEQGTAIGESQQSRLQAHVAVLAEVRARLTALSVGLSTAAGQYDDLDVQLRTAATRAFEGQDGGPGTRAGDQESR